MKLVRSFDFFTKAKEEIDTSTGLGGFFTLLGAAFGALFLLIEFSSFMSTTWITEMSVENDLITKKERVNIDILFHQAPCQLITLSHEEENAPLVEDIHIMKERIAKDGRSLGPFKANNDEQYINSDNEFNDLVKALKEGEQCKVYGNFTVSEVPGYFEFNYREKYPLFRKMSEQEFGLLSLSHTLNHMTVGLDTNHAIIRNKYKKDANFAPYDGKQTRNLGPADHYQVFIKIVPNYYYYRENDQNGLQAYQYSLTSQSKPITDTKEMYEIMKMGYSQMPALKVTYEFSPITVNHYRRTHSFARFLVETLAIIGGIFSIFGMLNTYYLQRFKDFIR